MNPMKLEFQNPATREQQAVEVEPWRLFAALAACTLSFRAQAAMHLHAAMLANPQFVPARREGEEATEAYARRAVEHADALMAELHRREANEAKAEAAERGQPAREEGEKP